MKLDPGRRQDEVDASIQSLFEEARRIERTRRRRWIGGVIAAGLLVGGALLLGKASGGANPFGNAGFGGPPSGHPVASTSPNQMMYVGVPIGVPAGPVESVASCPNQPIWNPALPFGSRVTVSTAPNSTPLAMTNSLGGASSTFSADSSCLYTLTLPLP